MKNRLKYRSLLPTYCILLMSVYLLAVYGSRAITILTFNSLNANPKTVIIDAGHGGEDGGATSCTGVLESHINLQISLKLNDLLHLLGVNTVMIRDGDYSVYTQGESLSQKKVSDLKERVRIINNTNNAILVSIHQNYFSDQKYLGAQVFHASTNDSQNLAKQLQCAFLLLDAQNNRTIKKADGIFLMQHIRCPGALIECGFLSNPREEALLRSNEYQNKLCSVIASVCSTYLNA